MADINYVVEEMDDILCSGYGSNLTNFHKTELTKLIDPLTDDEKKEVWGVYQSNSDDWEEWGVGIDEVHFIGELCGVKKSKIKFY